MRESLIIRLATPSSSMKRYADHGSFVNKPKKLFEDKAKAWSARHGKDYQSYVKTSAVGLEFGLSIAIGALGGYFADKYFQSSPIGLIIGVIFGTAAGVKRLWLFTKSYVDKSDNPNKDDKD